MADQEILKRKEGMNQSRRNLSQMYTLTIYTGWPKKASHYIFIVASKNADKQSERESKN